jgi:peptidoglycan LD-endopeptidase LytH
MVLVLAGVMPSADADSKSALQAARERLSQIDAEIRQHQALLERLQARAEALANKVTVAEGKLEEIRSELADTKNRLAEASDRYHALQARLDERAKQMYMQGGAGDLEFLLGSSSLGELSDRIEFSNVVAGRDVDLATEVANLRKELELTLHRQQELQRAQIRAVTNLRSQLAALQKQFAEQRALVGKIAAQRRQAEEVVSNLKRRYQQALRQQIPAAGGGSVGAGPFQACPVGQPRAVTNSFGAPRYGGGYHLHAGNDIMAPSGTPIYATFEGTATSASNSLGGLTVMVSGAAGYTYNAHMSGFGQLGSVHAGDVIGYVGATGDTSTPHNHFEWHPNVIPSNWPESPYGYSVIGDAVNPYPILQAVC